MNPLLKYRTENNLTLVEVSAPLNVTPQCYSNWERGKRFPRRRHIAAIEMATGGAVHYQNLLAAFVPITLSKLSQLKEAATIPVIAKSVTTVAPSKR
jgi:hypothetical protein